MVIGPARRVMAIGALTLARWTLWAAMALFSRGALSRPGLRAALTIVRCCERAGGWLALGRQTAVGARRASKPPRAQPRIQRSTNKELSRRE